MVTVIIPTGKAHLRYLPAALASVAAQTEGARVIVANDSGEALPFEVAPNVTVLDVPAPPEGFERGQRAARARNYALERVQTPLVTFLDADDAMTPPAIEIMLAAYRQDDKKYVYGDAHTITTDGKYGTWTSKAYNALKLIDHNLHTITALVPTAWAREVGGFDDEFKAWEDWAFYLRLAAAGRQGRRVPFPLITYRLHTGDNRVYGDSINGELYGIMRRKYEPLVREAVMACGGCGSKKASVTGGASRMAAKAQPTDWVQMEYAGTGSGARTWSKQGRVYRVSATRNIFSAHPDDVEWLIKNGLFRRVPAPSVPPKAETFSEEVKTTTKIDAAPKAIRPKETANDAKAAKRSAR
jgi:hypothetical protein